MSELFLNELIDSVLCVEQAARDDFAALTDDQINWRPGEDRWSIGECLNHLITANEPYFPIFESVANGTKSTTFWERLPILPGVFGSLVLNTVKPETKRKSRAPKIFAPPPERVSAGIVEQFCEQQQRLIKAIQALEGADFDGTIVTSPVGAFITYSLRNALLIVVRHEERHLNQAQAVHSAMNAAESTA